MSCEQYKPYVISADVKTSLTSWADNTGYTVPKPDYFKGMLGDMRSVLRGYFPDVEIITEEILSEGLRELSGMNGLTIVSLDRFYTNGISNITGYVDFTRSVDTTLTSTGLVSRTPVPIDTQIQKVSAGIDKTSPITLLDDVIFGGDTMLEIVDRFAAYGIKTANVIAGIAVDEGITKLNKAGIRVDAVITYQTVIDEICERDFVVGAPNSGRTIVIGNKIYGVPYLLPFGKPFDWASIPKEKEQEFSLFCITQAAVLWEKIDRQSSATVPNRALAKSIYGIDDDRSVADALKNIKKQLQGGSYEQTK